MTDRWYFTHAGQTLGPVTVTQLRQLAANGQLDPADLIWPEGKDLAQAVPVQAAIDFSTPATPQAASPDWLDDVRATEEKPPAASATPDWLDDVRNAEEIEQAFLSIAWDGDNAPIDVEPVKKEPLDAAQKITKVQTGAISSCRLVLGSATTRGRVRDLNEDSLLVQQCSWGNLDQRHDFSLIVVADGMGGHQAGERASGLVIRTVGAVLAPVLAGALSGLSPDRMPTDLAETLDRGLHEANRTVYQTAKEDASCKGMGSTAVALLVWDGHAFISLVGDCRVYHWRAGQLTQVTRDQTLVARMVELGQLTPEEAAAHPRRNEVTQAIGKYARIEPERYELTLIPGDWLVASCDGLCAHVEDRMLQDAIGKAGDSAIGLANQLIDLANQGGGSDNCSVVVMHSL